MQFRFPYSPTTVKTGPERLQSGDCSPAPAPALALADGPALIRTNRKE